MDSISRRSLRYINRNGNESSKTASSNLEQYAGILLHISSLPGDFGIGDFGPGAIQFINFLENAHQHYWQVLPLSITNRSNHHSPYSSHSAFAGNWMFIDPFELASAGLIKKSSLKKYRVRPGETIDFEAAERAKRAVIREAFETFRNLPDGALRKDFYLFIKEEKNWLNDFALYECLRNHFDGLPWNNWPEKFRDRNPEKLRVFGETHKYELELICFTQFIFSRQWRTVKAYASKKRIRIFGDIPIYIDYNSADVWSHPEYFQLRNNRSMKVVAGVPPDYFSEEGQRWGMPLFNWHVMEKDQYNWWLRRIEKNLEWFDLLRLDHFRGFSAYWEIPADSDTAVNGKWVKGPGKKFFDAVRQRIQEMPFVAEDLGMIDQDVYDLRDRYELPGMKVLQFGFGDSPKTNGHHPVNIKQHSVVYTGTHDNNTLKGWFIKEVNDIIISQLKGITGKRITSRNIHIEMIRIAFATMARIVIIPMQDWLGLGEEARMNFPATTNNNWQWKIVRRTLSASLVRRILKITRTYNR